MYALLNINRYDPGMASFGTWLYAITVSRCRDRYRRRRLRSFSLWSLFGKGRDLPGPDPGPERVTIQSESDGETRIVRCVGWA